MTQRGCLLIVLLAGLFSASAAWAVETEEAITAQVRQTYALTSEEYEIEITANQLETRLVDPADLQLRPLSQKEPLGAFTIYAAIVHEGDTVETGQVRLRIRRFAEVMVAVDRIKRHETLTEQQFELKRTDVTDLREQPIVAAEELAGQRSRRNLRLGSILTTGTMEAVPDVINGDEVTITLSDTWGSVTAHGKVLQDGLVGNMIRVKNLATGKIILAEVTSGKTVEVNP